MVLQVYHTTPTTPAGAGFNTDITGSVRISTKRNLAESADLGGVTSYEITVDDPNLALSFVPRQAIALVETDAPAGDQRVITGYIASTSVVRCDDRLCMLQGRIWLLEVSEFNALLAWRIVRGEASARPQETAENRLLWLLSTTFLNGVDDLGRIDWTDPAFDTVMSAVDYAGQWGKAVLDDIAAQTGLGYYAHIDETLGNDAGLAVYDFNTYTGYASTLRLSNVAADIDLTTTFPVSLDTKWRTDGERIAPGVYATGAAGLTSYGYSPTTQYAFGNVIRDQAAPMPNVTTQTALDAARVRLQDQHAEGDERITTRVQVPAARVNAIRKGHSLPIRLSHAPGRSAFTDWRVIERTVSVPENEGQAVYDIDLDLVPMADAGGRAIVVFLVIRTLGSPHSITLIPDGFTQLNATDSTTMYGDNANGQVFAFWAPSTGVENNLTFAWNGSAAGWGIAMEVEDVVQFSSIALMRQYPYDYASPWLPRVNEAAFDVPVSVPVGAIVSCIITSTAFNSGALAGPDTLIHMGYDPPGGSIPIHIVQWRDFAASGTYQARANVSTAPTLENTGSWGGAAVVVKTTGRQRVARQGISSVGNAGNSITIVLL